MTTACAIFVFTADQDLLVFPSVEKATAYLEAVDVQAGEYPAIYSDQGTIFEASATGQTVILLDTDRSDSDDLRRRIKRYSDLSDAPTPTDLLAFANKVLQSEWEARWPQRPQWLARRIHGEAPPSV